MGLAADRQTRIRAGGATRSGVGDVAASTKIYFGSLIARNATGYIVPASDAAALKVIGIAQQFVDNSAGADGALTVSYITGVEAEFVNAGGAIVQAGKLAKCYVSDDQSVTSKALALHKILAGTVISFTTTTVFVFVEDVLGADTDSGVTINGAVGPAVLQSNAIEQMYLDIPDAATATYAYLNADKIEIVDVTCIKDGAGAANTIQIKTTADVAISDAIAFAVDKAVTRAGTLDKAQRTINAGAGFHITATKAAGVNTGQVVLHVIKR